MSELSPTVALARELIRRPSPTPDDGGCQRLLAARLERIGFAVEHLPSGDVDNLYARLGTAAPLLVFAGHTDVVPTGDVDAWRHDPFAGTLDAGELHGRGAADMKGGVAAFITALERAVAAGAPATGSLGVLLTSDEEGPALEGTRHVVDVLRARNEHIDYCVLGEPSSGARFGDTMRIGRRGSLGATLTVRGRQGHVAYPAQADNPVHRLVPFLHDLLSIEWDRGNAAFPPTTLQVSNLAAGTGASNVIPGTAELRFNLRYSPESPEDRIRARIESLIESHALDCTIEWQDSARPFVTADGRLVQTLRDVIHERTGLQPEANTAGGTSDGRFIAPHGTELVEFGPINATIHSIDERVDAADLDSLSSIYEAVIDRLLSPSPSHET